MILSQLFADALELQYYSVPCFQCLFCL